MLVSKEELISTYVIFTHDRKFFKDHRVVGKVVKVRAVYYFNAKTAKRTATYLWDTNTDVIQRVGV